MFKRYAARRAGGECDGNGAARLKAAGAESRRPDPVRLGGRRRLPPRQLHQYRVSQEAGAVERMLVTGIGKTEGGAPSSAIIKSPENLRSAVIKAANRRLADGEPDHEQAHAGMRGQDVGVDDGGLHAIKCSAQLIGTIIAQRADRSGNAAHPQRRSSTLVNPEAWSWSRAACATATSAGR